MPSEPETRRHRHADSGGEDKKRTSPGEKRRRKKKTKQVLSMDALAQLNESNTGSSTDPSYRESAPAEEEARPKRKRKERREVREEGREEARGGDRARGDAPAEDKSKRRESKRRESTAREGGESTGRDEPRTRRESRARDEPRTRREPRARDEPRTRREPRERDAFRTRHESRDAPRTRRAPRERDASRTRHKSRDEPRTRRESRAGDEPRMKREPRSGGESRTRHESREEPRTRHESRDDTRARHASRDEARARHASRDDSRARYDSDGPQRHQSRLRSDSLTRDAPQIPKKVRARVEARTQYEAVPQDDEQREERRDETARDDSRREEKRRRKDRGDRGDRRRDRPDNFPQRDGAPLQEGSREEKRRPEERCRDIDAESRPKKAWWHLRRDGGSDRIEADGYARVEADGHGDWEHRRRRDRRIPSGAILEEGRSRGVAAGHLRGGAGSSNSSTDTLAKAKSEKLYYTQSVTTEEEKKKKKKFLYILAGVSALVVIIIAVVVGVVVSKKKSGSSASGSSASGSTDTGTSTTTASTVPADAPTWLDPALWADTTDFNLTYTNETVGGLPVMGLNATWDDSAAANDDTAALNTAWGSYATTPARGVNLGGWLSLEPFITPSLFAYDESLGIIDEYTLCAYLGADTCSSKLEAHYATFVTESTFAEIAAAGLDHVRIPYSYWAVAVYDDDPYLYRTSWRYLLRGIEWARRYGLRVNLDLHGLPGSQNGWNHSGRQGAIGWMNGTDGDLNVQRSLDVHGQLSQFFAQARYANVISHYGLANEPRMTYLSVSAVMNWTQTAAKLVRANGVVNSTVIVFGDGFCGLTKWQGQANDANLALDVHQYEIFNNEQIVYTHAAKIAYACSDWTAQTEQSMNTSTGFGPTIVAEWSQADTDCATYLGNVGNGNRWTGTYDVGNASLNALTPKCPAQNASCQCDDATADVSAYSDEYKAFLLTFAEAQMYSFEKGWGWWYWTWDTESAPQWSYKQGLAAGILPAKASQRTFQCDLDDVPDFSSLSELY